MTKYKESTIKYLGSYPNFLYYSHKTPGRYITFEKGSSFPKYTNLSQTMAADIYITVALQDPSLGKDYNKFKTFMVNCDFKRLASDESLRPYFRGEYTRREHEHFHGSRTAQIISAYYLENKAMLEVVQCTR